MKRRAWAFLILVPLLFGAAPAWADHGGFHGPGAFVHNNGRMFFRPGGRVFFHNGAFFARDGHRFFFPRHRVFFRPFFFFGNGIFAPLAISLFPPPAPPAYLMGPIDGYPSCYDYQMSGMYGGQPPYGAACIGQDGSWQVVPGYGY
jgi:hypothetical protein